MLRITQLNIRIGIKNGLGFDDFCEKYQCSKDEFEHVVGNLYRRDARKIITEIDKNSRKNTSKSHRSKNNSGMQKLEELHSTTSPGGAPKDELKQLKSLEAELSAAVISLETKHKQLIRKHHDNLGQLYKIQNQLEAIRQSFQDASANYESLVVCNNELVQEINSVGSLRTTKRSELNDVRQKIENLTKITLCIYSDGKIEPMDTEENILLDESGSETIHQNLISQQTELCQDLRLRDIFVLARLMAIIRNSDQKFNLLFEDNSLEQHFYQLS